MDELKLTGNCLKWSRPLLHFDATFETQPHLQLIKEVFTHVFAAPDGHPKVKPFFDHILCFYVTKDNKIWFRNFQIVDRLTGSGEKMKLAEIGPRFVLDPVRILSGSFDGDVLYNHDFYVAKKSILQLKTQAVAERKIARQIKKQKKEALLVSHTAVPLKAVWFEK